MYFWKCWRDHRMLFIGCVLSLVGMAILFTITLFRLGEHHLWKGTPELWSTTAFAVLGVYGSMITMFWALALGVSSLGEEFQKGTTDFLLSRPRRRRYWVWAGWSAGVCELAVATFLTAAAALGTLACLTHQIYTWRMLAAALPLTVGGAAVYGMAYFMALVARSGRRGLGYGVGILVIHLGLPAAVRMYWKVHIPAISNFIVAGCKSAVEASGHFPFLALAAWTAVALAFPFAAQLLLERMEA